MIGTLGVEVQLLELPVDGEPDRRHCVPESLRQIEANMKTVKLPW